MTAGMTVMPSAPDDELPPTLAHNVVHFVRVLRGAGLPMSPSHAAMTYAPHWPRC
jgi:uncharacterized protein with von Willebrand factor type A (vWA) domain